MISCFGDSNTYGYDPFCFMGRYDEEDRWPEILSGLTGIETDNLGINGREIPHTEIAYKNAAAQITEERMPELIIIMLGTNDKYIMPDATPEKVADRMDLFLTDLHSRLGDVPILLISPPGTGFGPCYEEVARRHGTAFADADGWDIELAYDNVHFIPRSNHVFAQHVFDVLKEEGLIHA